MPGKLNRGSSHGLRNLNLSLRSMPSAEVVGSDSSDNEDVYVDDDEPKVLPPEQANKGSGRNTSNNPSPTKAPKLPIAKASKRNTAQEWKDVELERQYDLTPVENKDGNSDLPAAGSKNRGRLLSNSHHGPPSFSIDPWETAAMQRTDSSSHSNSRPGSPGASDVYTDGGDEESENAAFAMSFDESVQQIIHGNDNNPDGDPTFLMPGDIHPQMEHKEDEISQLRLLAGQLSKDWRSPDFMAPALARRIRDFQFAQEKRRKRYGDERPWGILGLYDHLSAIRTDVEWAEDAAWRRANGEPYLSWAEFDESKRSGYNRPFFTYVLLFTCTVVMIASIGVNGWQVEPLDVNPMIGPSAATLIKMGAKDTYLIVNENEGWRLLTSTVLHAGLVHYFVNMLALWFVGAAIEQSHGWAAAMIIFGMSAVGGTILSALCLPEYITVGASGGIFGFIGACLADIIMNWKLLFCDFVTENGKKHRHAMVVVVLLLDIALNCIIGLTPFVDNFTHLGGMAYGFLCGLSTMERLSSDFFGLEEGVWTRTKHFAVRFSGLIISIVTIIITLVILLQGDGESNPCPNCTWLSCVPFPPWADDKEKWWYCDDCGRVTADIVSDPSLHLELDCPSGAIAEIPLDDESSSWDRDALTKKLPDYCREYCPSASS